MKAFYRYILVAVISLRLVGLGSGACCHTPHDNGEKSNTSHTAHTNSVHSRLSDIHDFHQVDLSQKCCQTSSNDPADYTRIFILPNNTKTVQDSLITTFSHQIAINCFHFSAKNSISEITDLINPTLTSLRTVVLRT